MAATINTSKLYQQDEFADVMVKFGDEEMKCHRLVLGMRSKYFRTLLKPDSGFMVGILSCKCVYTVTLIERRRAIK